MDIDKAKSASDLVSQLTQMQGERDGYQAILDTGSPLDTLVVRALNESETAIVLAAVLSVYDARLAALNASLEGL